MYSSTASKRVIGIVDSAWPESASIEQVALALGFEVVVSTEIEGLARQEDLRIVVTKLRPGTSLQSMIESMRTFGEEIQFVIRADASDLQTVTTLARIPSVHVVDNADITTETWKSIFEAQSLASSNASEMKIGVPEAPETNSPEYVFVDPKSQHLLAVIERLAITNAPVLLQGATGSGKEVVAKTLHELSNRSNSPFIALNCAAMPEHLVEDMLFGHEKGAFTGATRELAGVFEQAQGGTVFLDEIGEMPVQVQAKLLRVLQERKSLVWVGEIRSRSIFDS